MQLVKFAKRNRVAWVAAAATMFFSHAAFAANITYTLSGVGSGNVNATSFDGASFSITFAEDTSAITSPDIGYYEYSNITGTFTEGSTTETFTNDTLEVNGNPDTGIGNFEDVFLFNSDFGTSLGISEDATLLDYTLGTPITTGDVLPPQIGAFEDATGFTTQSGDVVTFSSVSSLNFTAADAAAPEPSAFALFSVGLGVLALKRWVKS